MALQVKFEIFRSDVNSWKSLFKSASNFATLIGPERVINISHSADRNDGLVTVWYWNEEDANILGIQEPE